MTTRAITASILARTLWLRVKEHRSAERFFGFHASFDFGVSALELHASPLSDFCAVHFDSEVLKALRSEERPFDAPMVLPADMNGALESQSGLTVRVLITPYMGSVAIAHIRCDIDRAPDPLAQAAATAREVAEREAMYGLEAE